MGNETVYIVGKDCDQYGWHFQGVFSDINLAIQACLTPNHFIGPAIVNEQLPEKASEWVGAWRPIK